MGRFSGKTAIITGSSNGIGRGIAVLFAREGAQVTITGRNEKTLEETKQMCLEAGAKDDQIHSIIGDFQVEKTLEKLVNGTVEKFGKIDILINNAGAGDRDRSGQAPGFLTQDISGYDYVMNINLRCIVQLTKLAVPHLEKTKGEVVNIGSICAGPVATTFVFYAMSKAALDQLTHSLAIELIPKGIRVNCIKPGVVRTDIISKAGLSQEQIDAMYQHYANDFASIPAGFEGLPEDVANLTAFLCDREQSRYLIGQCIVLDGGTSLMNPLLSSNPLNMK